MTRYAVQFELPVNDPVNNVRIKRGKKLTIFFVPINHPNAHNMGYQELLEAVEFASKSPTVHTS